MGCRCSRQGNRWTQPRRCGPQCHCEVQHVSFVDRVPPEEGSSGPGGGSRWIAYLRAAIRGWALLGGAIILGLVLITAASALSNLFLGAPFSGEYELAKHFVGIAIFTFLPYCQLTGANVTVDIFTERMSRRAKS